MDKWGELDYTELFAKMKSRIAQLSIQKFSSNVVEKCLKMSSNTERDDIILHIAKIDKLAGIMKNSFGNYVVQTALSLASYDVKQALTEAIERSIPDIQDKKIRTKWEQILGLHSFNNSPERSLPGSVSQKFGHSSLIDGNWTNEFHQALSENGQLDENIQNDAYFDAPLSFDLHPMNSPVKNVVFAEQNFENSITNPEPQNDYDSFNHVFGMSPCDNDN